MKASPIKNSFNSGELSPLIAGRTDQVKYGSGCSILQNFLPTTQGPIIRRGGSYYINDSRSRLNRSWMKDFIFNVTQSYQLEFGNFYMRFYTNRGVVLESATVISGATKANPCVITDVAHGFSSNNWIYIAGVVGMTQLNGKMFKATVIDANHYSLVDIDGNAIDSTGFSTYSSGGTASRVYEVATPYAIADLTDSLGNFALKFVQSNNVMYMLHPSYQTQKLSRLGNTNWSVSPVSLTNGPFQVINTDKTKTVYSSQFSAAVTGAANNGAGLIRLQLASTAALATGNTVTVNGTFGTAEANGRWVITVIDATHIDLQGSVFSKAWTSGGTITGDVGTSVTLTASAAAAPFLATDVGELFYLEKSSINVLPQWSPGISVLFKATVTNAANNGAGLVRLTVNSTTGLLTGSTATVAGITGTTEANGQWTVTVIDATHIDLQNSAFVNAYVAGGLVTTPGIYRAGNNTYIALNAGVTGTVTPTHTEGVVVDGNPGILWLYNDSGFGVVQISAFTSTTSVTATIVTQLPGLVVGAGNTTYRWAHSLFSATFGWPEIGTFFRDRLTLIKGIQAAFSVTSDYENFAPKIGGLQTADSGIVITLPTTNPPRWAVDVNDLLIGTGGDEILVTEITNTQPFGPTNVRARRQTKYGSRNVDAQLIGYGVLFATRSGQKLRDMRYNWQINGYDSIDLTVWAEHIAKGVDGLQGIVQTCYQAEPYNIMWACTTDGKLIAFTYNREQEVQGWHNHPIGGNGIVESVSCIPAPDGTRDDVWMIVKRTINGVTRRYIEYITPEFLSDDAHIADAFYVDAGLTYSGSSTSVISGFYHLKNTLVDVLANGGAHPQITVDANGSATLQFAVTKAQIGLPCPARMRTMRMEAGSANGTSQGKVKRITHIIMRLFKALGGWYGPDNTVDGLGQYTRMDQLQYRQADGLMDTPPPMLSGDTGRLLWPNGDDYTDGFVDIINDTPTPMTVVALMADEVTNDY